MIKKNLHVFDRDLEMVDTGPKVFALTLSDKWNIAGSTLNGGYLMAVIARAMEHCSTQKATPVITANYISKCVPGKALAHVEVIFESGNFTRLMVRLVQQGKEKIRAMGTFSSDVNEDVLCEYETGPPVIASFEECFQVPVTPDNALFDNVDLRLDPSCAGWLTGERSGRSEFKGWVRFKEKRKIDIPAILLFADTYPPPVFAKFGPSTWVPTIELSVNIRKVPDTQILKGIFKSRFVSGGLVEEDGELWNTHGELVAVSRQISKYRKIKE
ncbi:thioesterase family protein [Desulfobacula phenolica]|uniref:Acyl-CoA thioesterase n=1 Tax=Desulfobacula phenolica TaxID=90732 RepID=A0A1H2HT05_9BACT|nr:thioesterase family protein [Desulfobacula phenolica]SDU34688.1 Acyl-CoA thioesterase [Desulfobacula phenolica]